MSAAIVYSRLERIDEGNIGFDEASSLSSQQVLELLVLHEKLQLEQLRQKHDVQSYLDGHL